MIKMAITATSINGIPVSKIAKINSFDLTHKFGFGGIELVKFKREK